MAHSLVRALLAIGVIAVPFTAAYSQPKLLPTARHDRAVPCPDDPAPCPPVCGCPARVVVTVPQPEVEFRTAPAECAPCAAEAPHRRLFFKPSCQAPSCAPTCVTAPAQQMVVSQPSYTMVPVTTVPAAPVQMQYVAAQPTYVQAQVVAAPQPAVSVQPVQVVAAPVQQVAPVQLQPVTVVAPQPVQVQPATAPQAAEVPCPEYDLRIAAALIARARQNMAAQPGAAQTAPQAATASDCEDVCGRLKRIEERLSMYGKAIDKLITDRPAATDPPPTPAPATRAPASLPPADKPTDK